MIADDGLAWIAWKAGSPPPEQILESAHRSQRTVCSDAFKNGAFEATQPGLRPLNQTAGHRLQSSGQQIRQHTDGQSE
jgi:hypothetical protein